MNTNKLNHSSTFGQKELTDGYYTNDLNSIDQKGMDGCYRYCRLQLSPTRAIDGGNVCCVGQILCVCVCRAPFPFN